MLWALRGHKSLDGACCPSLPPTGSMATRKHDVPEAELVAILVQQLLAPTGKALISSRCRAAPP